MYGNISFAPLKHHSHVSCPGRRGPIGTTEQHIERFQIISRPEWDEQI